MAAGFRPMSLKFRTFAFSGDAGLSPWRPSALFASNEQGLWYDPSSFATTHFQDSAGTTPVTAVEQPVGLILDKRLGLVRGPELVTVAADRDLSADTGFWTKASVSFSGGKVIYSGVVTGNGIYRAAIVPAGAYVEATIVIATLSAGGMCIYAGGNRSVTVNTVGTHTLRVTMGSTDTLLKFESQGASTTLELDSVSIKQVLGNHATQATSAARPVLKLEGALYYDKFDGVDDGDGTATFAAGTLTSDMDCFMLVRRDSGNAVLGMFDPPGSDNYFGVTQAEDGQVTYSGVGDPATYVNGVLTPFRASMFTAMPAGQWCVVEIRNLNLSLWTKIRFGNYDGFQLNGAFGERILCPAQSADSRATIRQYLAAKAGITL